MKLIDIAIDYNKNLIHDQYINFVDDFKDYDKITRKEMLYEIINFYKEDYNRIIDYCNYKELKMLEDISKNKEIEYDDTYKSLSRKLLVLADQNVVFPEEIEENIRKAIKNVDYKKVKKRDEINKRFIGLMKLYGVTDIKFIVHNYVNIFDTFENVSECYDYMKQSLYLKFYIFCDSDDLVYYNNYYYIEDTIINIVDGLGYKLFSKEEIESISNSKYDIDEKYFNKIENILSEYNISNCLVYAFVNFLIEELNTSLNFEMIENRILNLLKIFNKENYKEYVNITKRIIEVILDMPLFILRGNSLKDIAGSDYYLNHKSEERKKELLDDEVVEKYKKIRKESIDALSDVEPFIEEKGLFEKYANLININKAYCDIASFNTFLVTFLSIDNEDSPFNIYFRENVNLNHKYYSILNYIRNFHYSSLFKVVEVNSEKAKLIFKDVKDDKEYEIIDINLSNYEMLENMYLYTSLFKIYDIFMTSGYVLIFEEDNIDVLLERIEKEKRYIKLATNKEMIEILAAVKVYLKNENIKFSTVDI